MKRWPQKRRWGAALIVPPVLLALAACTGGGGPGASQSPSPKSSPPVELSATDEASDGGELKVDEVGYTKLDSYDGVVDVLAAAKVTNTSKDDWLHQADIEFVFTAGGAEDTVGDNKLADLAPGESTVIGRLMTVDFAPDKLKPVAKQTAWYPKADVKALGTDLKVDVRDQSIKPGDKTVKVSAEYETFDDKELLSRLYASVAVRDAKGELLGAAQLDSSETVDSAGDHSTTWEFNAYEWPQGATAKQSEVVLRCVTCLP